jgi:Zn-dependent protease with chaperone function
MSRTVNLLRTGREKFYRVLMVIVGIVVWIALVVGFFLALREPRIAPIAMTYLAYVVIIVLFLWFSAAAYRAAAFGNMLLLSPQQFPDLHQMVVDASQDIGLDAPPKVFLYNSNGLFNAFARRLLGGRFVFLTSALVEATSDQQVRFVIGHEIGHHAAGHLDFWMNLIKFPARLIPFLGTAYSRSRETTCDNIGAYLAKDFNSSRSALQMLGCGCGRLNQVMNCEAFMAQEAMVPPVFGFLTEIFRSHPRLTRRVANIRDYASF